MPGHIQNRATGVICVLSGTGGGSCDAKFKQMLISMLTKLVIPMQQGSSLFRKQTYEGEGNRS